MKKNSYVTIVFLITFFILIVGIPSTSSGMYRIYDQRDRYEWQDTTPVTFLDCYGVIPRIKILLLEVSLWPEGAIFDYSIHWMIHNREAYNVTVEIEHTMILPDGSATTSSDIWELPAKMIFACFMDCEYTNELYGVYTFGLTIRDPGGVIFDSETVRWGRHPYDVVSLSSNIFK